MNVCPVGNFWRIISVCNHYDCVIMTIINQNDTASVELILHKIITGFLRPVGITIFFMIPTTNLI